MTLFIGISSRVETNPSSNSRMSLAFLTTKLQIWQVMHFYGVDITFMELSFEATTGINRK